MPIDAATVENAKQAQRVESLPCRNCTFDEALFQIVKDKLKANLSEVSEAGTISEQSQLYLRFKDFVIRQIEQLVDTAIHALYETDNPLAGHQTRPGRRVNLISPHHDVIRRRARHLVEQLQPELGAKRITGIRLTVADVMNTTDWERLTRVFWRSYRP
ncbi:hypothetical protein [Brevundimonas sp. LM2]|uniref:hypothetical protein n=1 Tax=Brevundimonas sp. LM2 TaxID=1938605 RepID=UPI00123788B9|nr:hypothetical protein [Brevundimonas sp. LM2]